MSTHDAVLEAFSEQICLASKDQTKLRILGGNTKSFYGNPAKELTTELSVRDYAGVISYDPSELVVTARAGTPLLELQSLLADKQQHLEFEPPVFGAQSTLGGAIASAFAGPRRPYRGSVRDMVLGVTLMTGAGKIARFGGQVMKNVAGYDVSRLMVGSMGTLALLLDISVRVGPSPVIEKSLVWSCGIVEALAMMTKFGNSNYPISGLAHHHGQLRMRVSGAGSSVEDAARMLNAQVENNTDFWTQLKNHRLPFFQSNEPIWRIDVPPATADLPLAGETLIDWGGARRWLISTADEHEIIRAAENVNGHANLYRPGQESRERFAQNSPASGLSEKIKHVFDPADIFCSRAQL